MLSFGTCMGLLALAAAPSRTSPAAKHDPSFLASTLDDLASAGGASVAEVGDRAAELSFDAEAERELANAAAARTDEALVGLFPRLLLYGRAVKTSQLPPQPVGTAVAAPFAPVGPLPPGTPLVNAAVAIQIPATQKLVQAVLTVPLTEILLKGIPALAASHASAEEAGSAHAFSRLKAGYVARQLAWARVRAILAVQVASRAFALAQSQAEDTSRAEAVGTANRADLARAQARMARAQQTLAEAQAQSQLLEERLRVALHLPGSAQVTLREDLRRPLPPLPGTFSAEAALKEALAARPDVRALDARERAAGAQAQAARSSLYPRLSAYGEATDGEPNPRYVIPPPGYQTTWSVGVELSYSPNEALSGLAQGSALDAQARSARAQRLALEDAVRVDIAQALTRCRDADAAVVTSARELEAAELDLQMRTRLFEAGKATATELLESRSLATEAEYAVAFARVDQRLARLDLAYAQGRLD